VLLGDLQGLETPPPVAARSGKSTDQISAPEWSVPVTLLSQPMIAAPIRGVAIRRRWIATPGRRSSIYWRYDSKTRTWRATSNGTGRRVLQLLRNLAERSLASSVERTSTDCSLICSCCSGVFASAIAMTFLTVKAVRALSTERMRPRRQRLICSTGRSTPCGCPR
jgi:hypothetical protein